METRVNYCYMLWWVIKGKWSVFV